MATFLLHVDLEVTDVDRAVEFYTRHLEASVIDDQTVTGELPKFYSYGTCDTLRMVFLKFAAGRSQLGHMVELLHLSSSDGGRPASSPVSARHGIRNFTVAVEDLSGTIQGLREAGVELAAGPWPTTLRKLGTSKIAFVRDPDGNLIELVEAG